MVYLSKKGSIIIAMMFAIVLTIIAVTFFHMIGGRTAFTVNQLKREQAINCAEAALYETFNRIRAGQRNATINFTDQVNVRVADPSNTTTTYNVTVGVTYTAGTPSTVDATVNLTDIRL